MFAIIRTWLRASTAFACIALTGQAFADDDIEAIYAAAKKEGKVVVWSPNDIAVERRVEAAFSKRFPGIQVEAFKIEPGPAVERAVAEASAGRNGVDIIVTNAPYLPILFDRGMVESYPWTKVFGVPPELLLFDNRAVIVAEYDQSVSFNTDLVKPAMITSWEAVLEPQWRGKVILEARSYPLAIMAQRWGDAKTIAYIKKLLENKPTIVKGSTVAAEALAGGQGAIAIGAQTSRIQRMKEEGAPVDWARIEPVGAVIVMIAPIKNGPHPNAGRLWTWFWTQQEAQTVQYDVGRNGMLSGGIITARGKELHEKNIEILREPSDVTESNRLLNLVGDAISGRR